MTEQTFYVTKDGKHFETQELARRHEIEDILIKGFHDFGHVPPRNYPSNQDLLDEIMNNQDLWIQIFSDIIDLDKEPEIKFENPKIPPEKYTLDNWIADKQKEIAASLGLKTTDLGPVNNNTPKWKIVLNFLDLCGQGTVKDIEPGVGFPPKNQLDYLVKKGLATRIAPGMFRIIRYPTSLPSSVVTESSPTQERMLPPPPGGSGKWAAKTVFEPHVMNSIYFFIDKAKDSSFSTEDIATRFKISFADATYYLDRLWRNLCIARMPDFTWTKK
jgi:hypothetical protein